MDARANGSRTLRAVTAHARSAADLGGLTTSGTRAERPWRRPAVDRRVAARPDLVAIGGLTHRTHCHRDRPSPPS